MAAPAAGSFPAMRQPQTKRQQAVQRPAIRMHWSIILQSSMHTLESHRSPGRSPIRALQPSCTAGYNLKAARATSTISWRPRDPQLLCLHGSMQPAHHSVSSLEQAESLSAAYAMRQALLPAASAASSQKGFQLPHARSLSLHQQQRFPAWQCSCCFCVADLDCKQLQTLLKTSQRGDCKIREPWLPKSSGHPFRVVAGRSAKLIFTSIRLES